VSLLERSSSLPSVYLKSLSQKLEQERWVYWEDYLFIVLVPRGGLSLCCVWCPFTEKKIFFFPVMALIQTQYNLWTLCVSQLVVQIFFLNMNNKKKIFFFKIKKLHCF
jgi:hypothetical protein